MIKVFNNFVTFIVIISLTIQLLILYETPFVEYNPNNSSTIILFQSICWEWKHKRVKIYSSMIQVSLF